MINISKFNLNVKKEDYHIVSFSGGKDSTAMLLRMLELGMQVDEILFADTGMEFDELYRHIENVKEYVFENYGEYKFTRVSNKYDYKYFMFDYTRKRGSRKGEQGYWWMDSRNRWCTSELKIKPIRWHMERLDTINRGNINIIEYHGIAYDEKKRRLSNNYNSREVRYPLIDWGWSENKALDYCYELGFDWEGLYSHFNRLSCYLCPLQKLSELEIIYREFPNKWKHMKKLDEMNKEKFNRKFRYDYSISQLEDKFNNRPIRHEKVDLINLDKMIADDNDKILNDNKLLRKLAREPIGMLLYIKNNYKTIWDKMVLIDNEKVKNTKNGNPLRKDMIRLKNI